MLQYRRPVLRRRSPPLKIAMAATHFWLLSVHVAVCAPVAVTPFQAIAPASAEVPSGSWELVVSVDQPVLVRVTVVAPPASLPNIPTKSAEAAVLVAAPEDTEVLVPFAELVLLSSGATVSAPATSR